MPNHESDIQRVRRSKEQARATYDRLSRWYDVLAGSSERPLMLAGLSRLDVQEGEVVLEIGLGTGHGTVALARSVGDTGRVCGLDISKGMLTMARRRLQRAGLSHRVQLHCGDAADLPFTAQSFDAVFAAFTLELFDTPEIPRVLRECWRVLCDGGRLGVVSLSKPARASTAVRLYEWAHKRFPRYVDCRPIYARTALQDAGFRIAHVATQSMWGLPVEIALAEKTAFGAQL